MLSRTRLTRTLAVAILPLAAALSAGAQAKDAAPVQTVKSVDLQRYLGRWYEIANYPMFFQRKCVSDTTADYGALPDGKVSVLNRCKTEKGEFDEADGEAKVVPDTGNAQLEVSFFKPFSGDYWIIGLDPDYKWSVVGSPNRKYLWILSRTPDLPADPLEKALQAARAQGYTLESLRYTPQRGKTSEPTKSAS